MALIFVTTAEDTIDPDDGVTSLREALTMADDNVGADIITFDPGLPPDTTIVLTNGQLNIGGDVSINGDRDGDGTPDVTIDAQGQSRVIQIGSNVNVMLIGLGVINGITETDGGGINIASDSDVTISNSIISNNTSTMLHGGGINAEDNVSLIINDSIIKSNFAINGDGGGINIETNGTLTVINTDISENSAEGGGGLYNDNSDITIIGGSINNNEATFDDGGGILNIGGMLNITGTTISGNTAATAGGGIATGAGGELTDVTLADNMAFDGGGVAVLGGVLQVLSVVFFANLAVTAGAMLVRFLGSVTITDSEIIGNKATGEFGLGAGAVAAIESTTATIVNSIIADNTSQTHGGAFATWFGGTMTISDSLVANNTAAGSGGAVFSDGSAAGGVTVDNSVISGNIADGDGGAINSDGAPLTLVESLILSNLSGGSGGGVNAHAFNSFGSWFLDNLDFDLFLNDIGNTVFDGDKAGSVSPAADYGGLETGLSLADLDNSKPVAGDDSADTQLGVPVKIDVLANDIDVDGDRKFITSISATAPAGASTEIDLVDNTIIFNDNGIFGLVEFTYTVSDGISGSDTATVLVDVNAPPVPGFDEAQTNEDTSVTIDVLSNDTDPNSDTPRVDMVFAPINGTANLNPDNTITFTPFENFNGLSTFTYRVVDDRGGSAIGTVSVNVLPMNDPPVAAPDAATTDEDTAVIIDLLDGDSDPDGDTIAVTSAFAVNGTLTENPDGTFTYTPSANFNGLDVIFYDIKDPAGATSSSSAAITVSPVNDAPVAQDDAASVFRNSSVEIDVGTNDVDVDNPVLGLTGNLIVAPENGTVVQLGGTIIRYTPNPGYEGSDTFTYETTDGELTDTAAVTVEVVNAPPVAMDDSITVLAGSAIEIPNALLLSNDVDANGDMLVINGVLSDDLTVFINPETQLVNIIVEPTQAGQATFRYVVEDGHGGTDTATVTVSIQNLGTASDGYLAGATVFVDVNGNGVLDDGENSARTGVAGEFKLVSGQVGPLVAIGGTNADTGLANLVTFSAPAESAVINPLTTLIQQLVAGGSDVASAEAAVEAAFGLDSALELTQTDLIAAADNGDASALAAQKAATAVAEILDSVADAGGDVGAALAALTGLVDGGGSVDLTSQEVIQTVIAAGVAGDISQLVASTQATTQAIASAQNLDGISSAQAQEAPPQDFSMFASDGFSGGIGGSGAVLGTANFQDITVVDVPGTVALDPSFNRGGDIVRLYGNAANWFIASSGSSALLTDGDTIVTIPVGTVGLSLLFSDGARSLRFDTTDNSFKLGDQSFTESLAAVTAGQDGTPLPTGADPAAKAVLFIAADAGIAASGVVDIFGAAGDELARLISGNLTLDASFNRGGDTIAFDEAATDYSASQSGSLLRLTGSDTTALIPVGTNGATLAFGDGSDTRTLLLDTTIPAITIAGQQIGPDPVQLMAL